ncbi:nudix hydrolase 21, chloroplastic-like [Phragmites australis]|uniref:nudix hydrolase 21, chloroplastic-like n=1 Tax=Phragmites australis TaxID=29695 RepID=UPI002D797405|nr:nudix hydrolase 21, chloroplastic-like [Phragmites australis]
MAAVMVARQGRELQRYSDSTGGRVVVGCIPYRVRADNGEVEVLVISSQKKGTAGGVLIPKGGWELDESMDEAAQREAMEEAGVAGEVAGPALGRWWYRSRSYDATYEGIVLPLRVTRELERWPEMNARRRAWVTAAEAIGRCPHWWMREALQRFADRLDAAATAETMLLGSAL